MKLRKGDNDIVIHSVKVYLGGSIKPSFFLRSLFVPLLATLLAPVLVLLALATLLH